MQTRHLTPTLGVEITGVDLSAPLDEVTFGAIREAWLHNKVAVFDDKIMVTGSFNWTWSANNVNHENAIFIDDPRVIKRYTDEFNSLWVQ